jgi:hypothetical protein
MLQGPQPDPAPVQSRQRFEYRSPLLQKHSL